MNFNWIMQTTNILFPHLEKKSVDESFRCTPKGLHLCFVIVCICLRFFCVRLWPFCLCDCFASLCSYFVSRCGCFAFLFQSYGSSQTLQIWFCVSFRVLFYMSLCMSFNCNPMCLCGFCISLFKFFVSFWSFLHLVVLHLTCFTLCLWLFDFPMRNEALVR